MVLFARVQSGHVVKLTTGVCLCAAVTPLVLHIDGMVLNPLALQLDI